MEKIKKTKDTLKYEMKEFDRKLKYVQKNKELFPEPDKEIAYLMEQLETCKQEYGESV